jgi:hypothetical protein
MNHLTKINKLTLPVHSNARAPSQRSGFWVAVEANRARHEKAEAKRAKQEERTRLSSVLSACAWEKQTADPELLRAAKGFWIGAETQNAVVDVDRAWERAAAPRSQRQVRVVGSNPHHRGLGRPFKDFDHVPLSANFLTNRYVVLLPQTADLNFMLPERSFRLLTVLLVLEAAMNRTVLLLKPPKSDGCV